MPRKQKPRLTVKRVSVFMEDHPDYQADRPHCPRCYWWRTITEHDAPSDEKWEACERCKLPVSRWADFEDRYRTPKEFDDFGTPFPVRFADLEKLLSTGTTNSVVLTLEGEPKRVEADTIKGAVEPVRQQKKRKPTKFEKALAALLAEHEIEVEPDSIVELAVVAHSWAGTVVKALKDAPAIRT